MKVLRFWRTESVPRQFPFAQATRRPQTRIRQHLLGKYQTMIPYSSGANLESGVSQP
jgi:hypothetical protein